MKCQKPCSTLRISVEKIHSETSEFILKTDRSLVKTKNFPNEELIETIALYDSIFGRIDVLFLIESRNRDEDIARNVSELFRAFSRGAYATIWK